MSFFFVASLPDRTFGDDGIVIPVVWVCALADLLNPMSWRMMMIISAGLPHSNASVVQELEEGIVYVARPSTTIGRRDDS